MTEGVLCDPQIPQVFSSSMHMCDYRMHPLLTALLLLFSRAQDHVIPPGPGEEGPRAVRPYLI